VTTDDAFAGVRGQDEAVALLRRSVAAARVAHAYAFVGPAGSGRKLTALCFAKALVAAGDRAAAARVERGVHPDVRLIEPTPPESNPKGALALRIESIRALERLAALRPAEAPWKVFIVDGADRMTAATPQAFLKTLEEPPAHTVIVLILSQLRALPATVLSRCQIVRFRPALADGVQALLPDGRDEARRDALGVLAAAEAGGGLAILKAGEAVGRERQAAETLVESCALWYRDLLCRLAGADPRLMVFEAAAARPRERRPLDEVLAGLAACREAWQALQGNVSPRLTVEVLLSRLAPARA
jgi:DNA polymerase III subunit delta'